MVGSVVGLGLGLDLHFAVWVAVLQSTFMQLLLGLGLEAGVDMYNFREWKSLVRVRWFELGWGARVLGC